MKYLFVEYPKCSTCRNAKKWLEDNHIKYEDRHIIQDCPTVSELKKWIKESGLSVKKFFNTSGMMYKELNLKEKLPTLSEDKQVELLASHGMLIKRPLLIGNGKILVGFHKEEWERLL